MNSDAVQRFAPVQRDAAYALRSWMLDHGVSVKLLAAEMCIAEVSVTRWRTGERKPGRSYALKLERLTDGRITAASWDAEKEEDR